jgi:hypothetical protein
MMMKIQLLGLIFILSIPFYGFSQDNPGDLDLFSATFGMEKKVLTREVMDLDQVHLQKFWDLFNMYEVERKKLAKERWILWNQYAAQIGSMTNEQADDLMKEIIKHSKRTDKLINTYYKKLRKATCPKVAAQFYQLEHYCLSGIRMEIFNLLPIAGQID